MSKGGFPGGMNMQSMMKQAQQMQAQMEKVQAELEQKEVEASSGGGMVVVKANGQKIIKSITINEAVVDPDDIEMLQDLIIAAVNEALFNADTMMATEMNKITGGLNFGGLL